MFSDEVSFVAVCNGRYFERESRRKKEFFCYLYYKSEVCNKAPTKCYISVFIYFTTKVVHLELVRNLCTAAFLHAMKRFISIKKKPKQIRGDNATNFVGAKNRVLGSAVLNEKELHKIVYNFAAVVNSSPLVPISENSNDLDDLTPNHFQQGGLPSSFSELYLTKLNINWLDAWQRVVFLQL